MTTSSLETLSASTACSDWMSCTSEQTSFKIENVMAGVLASFREGGDVVVALKSWIRLLISDTSLLRLQRGIL